MHIELRIAARTTAAALALTVGLLGAAPATAAPRVNPKPKAKQPPARMSDLGGPKLALPGVQVSRLPGTPPVPGKVSALSWMVSDLDTGAILAAKNPHWALPPASTLKTLFADTVLPKIPSTATHKVLDSDLAGMGEGSSLVGVLPGKTYKVSDLWLGVFLRSGNDAVHVLAAMNGGVATTVTQMQAEAVALGARDTHVVSPDGYDMPGQVSSAFDLSLFARQGLKNPDFARYCSTAKAEFPGGPNTKGKPFEIDNTDRMLGGINGVPRYAGLLGGKNGYTTNAGNTLVVAAKRGGHSILVAVMNPQSDVPDGVYTEAAQLLDWGFAADGRTTPVGNLNSAVPELAPAVSTATPAPVAKAPGGPLDASGSSAGIGGLTRTEAGVAAAVVLAGAVGAVVVTRRRRGSRGRVLADPLD
ncbi:D-alanyl-D-alanine carboxypeptidase family protein [Streptacidiphilus cavernicola]|uniref:D-alanyl-D-alanine carboxypeptidase family protein n=1 Tax=Streptacidiphilus cavernicola TaxID=3342716 RepID=A0ABV6VTY1_9ACTN